MVQPLKPEYVPSAIQTLVDTHDACLISQTCTHAFLHSRVSHDDYKDLLLDAGGLHIHYCKLFQDTHKKSLGETHSQADMIYHTMDDTLDNVCCNSSLV